MKGYENTFVRGSSPSYSDSSETLPIESIQKKTSTLDNSRNEAFFQEKLNSAYDSILVSETEMKYGRNTFAFWSVVIILLILTVGNLILTLTIMGVLRLGKGIHGIELIPEEEVIKFYGDTDLDRVYAKNVGTIEGFADVPVSINGEDGGAVNIRLQRNTHASNRLILDSESGIQFRAVGSFEVREPHDGSPIFSTHRPHYNMPAGANVLVAKTASSSRIASEMGKPLTLESSARMLFKGSEGIRIDGLSAVLQAENNVFVNTNETIGLEADAGIFIDLDKMPIVSSEFGLRTGSVQYKMCVCMPHGNLFRIAIPRVHNGPKITCGHFSSQRDPCAIN